MARRGLFNKSAVAEIKRLTAINGGIITAEELVNFARDAKSPLHKFFEWNDTAAARQYRILQARDILRIVVEIVPNGNRNETMRVTAHLTSDTKGGYRLTTDILSDEEMTAQLLSDALAELTAFQNKYRRLKQLSSVFTAIEKTATKLKRPHRQKKAT